MLYWAKKVIGGSLPSIQNPLIHHGVLPSFAEMNINFSTGGGIYRFKGVDDDYRDFTILFCGTGGNAMI